MDKMCQKLEVEDLNKSFKTTGGMENARCESPVFKCVTQIKSAKDTFLNSSDYDIPSYQINQSVKSKTSSKYGNETSDSILPFSPIFTPISLAPVSQYQPPSIHSLGTIAKNLEKSVHSKLNNFSVSNGKEFFKPKGIFESLGMIDKDISWVSSMASPPPKHIPGNEFNTVEKATFLPEENFQSIQPRALFSPTFDDDFGCHPITFTSESDDDEVYKSNIRLSDVCATLKQLEVKSLDQVANNSVEKIAQEENCVVSPVIKAKRKRPESVKKKKRGTLVMSPQNKDNYEFLVSKNSSMIEPKLDNKVKSTEESNLIEDDSFQSISLSCIDELCKTLITEQSDSFSTKKASNYDKTLMSDTNIDSKSSKTVKKFYSGMTATDVYVVSSVDNLHLYAKALEEGDKYIPAGGKIDQSYADKGIVRFDILSKDSTKSDATKRLYSEVTEEKDESTEKKFKKVEDENCSWQNVKQYLSESQLNVSDGEIFRTVENLEKTLASQENREIENLNGKAIKGEEVLSFQNSHMLKASAGNSGESHEPDSITNSKYGNNVTEISKNETSVSNDKNLHAMSFPGFATASGSKISISEKALNKAREILKDCDENLENFNNKEFIDHLNVTGKRCQVASDIGENFAETSLAPEVNIKNSGEIVTKAKTFILEQETSKNSFKQSQPECNELPQDKFWEGLMGNFTNGLKKEEKMTADASEKLNAFISDHYEGSNVQLSHSQESFSVSSHKKIQFFEKFLVKAKAFEPDRDEEKEGPLMKGFKTATGQSIQVSAKSLEKAKALMSKCDEENFQKFTIKNFEGVQGPYLQNPESLKLFERPEMSDFKENSEVKSTILKGFSTVSGNTIQISAKALEKAKIFIKKCDQEFKQNFDYSKCTSDVHVMCKCSSNTEVCLKKFDGSENEVKSKICENLQTQKRDMEIPDIGFSTALGKKVKVSDKALENAKVFWSRADENLAGIPANSGKTFPASDLPSTADLRVKDKSKNAQLDKLPKAEEENSKTIQNEFESVVNFDYTRDRVKKSEKNPTPHPKISNEEQSIKQPKASEIDISDDWGELTPSWLHIYKTNPSMASDRIELSPIICLQDGMSFTPEKEYVVKSPVLGSGDRFYGKGKRRKLSFEEENKTSCVTVAPYNDAGQNINAKRTSNLDFSAPFKKSRVVNVFKTVNADVKEERARAREQQEKTVKDKQKVKPLEGSHLRKKRMEKQMSWLEAVGRSSPETHSDEFLRSLGISEDVLLVHIQNSETFMFNGEHFFGSVACLENTKGIPAGDECLLILDDDNRVGVKEFKRAFLASPGVQPNLLPRGWIENHYKWIVWKLAHYERSFPLYFGGRCLTPDNVMLQLKYRYDREIDRNERSALKKILERDDSSLKRLVLCVCGIKKVIRNDITGYELELTDGWYSCPARSDPAMSRLIEEGKLSVGMKLLTQGAVLVNCEQGVSPLELNEDVYLKISTNSTRRIRWDTKLGFQKNPENFPISLGSILAQGGPISRIDVIIVRIYPILYMEKTCDGHHVTRNRRSEEKADAEYRKIQEQKMENICNEVQYEMRKSANYVMKSNKNSLNDLEQVHDLCKLMETNSDSSGLQDLSFFDQRKLLEKLQSDENDHFSRELAKKIEKRLEQEKLKRRNVSEFLRMKIVDFRKPDFNNPALLSVWNPNEDLTSLLNEGKVVSVMNVTISNSSRVYKPLQINTTRQTQLRQIARNVKYPTRKLTPIKNVSSKVCPAFEEVDLVGMVVLVQDVTYGSRLSQVVYLTDLEMNYVGIVFWGSCKDFGWENVLRVPSIIACSNLQWKKNYTFQDVPSVYVNENSVFTENPKQDYLKNEIERLKQNLPQNVNVFLSKFEEDLTIKLEDSKWRVNSSKNSSNDSNLRENPKQAVNDFGAKPTASSTPIKPFTLRSYSDDVEPSPIQKRIEKLQSYGEPSPLMPLIVRNRIKRNLKKKNNSMNNQSPS